jgi:hypothetical protein
LVNPVAVPERRPVVATARDSLPGSPVGLVDSMLNPAAMWGQGMLDAAEQALRRCFPTARFDRVSRHHGVGSEKSTAWAAAMARLYRALVIAAGD